MRQNEAIARTLPSWTWRPGRARCAAPRPPPLRTRRLPRQSSGCPVGVCRDERALTTEPAALVSLHPAQPLQRHEFLGNSSCQGNGLHLLPASLNARWQGALDFPQGPDFLLSHAFRRLSPLLPSHKLLSSFHSKIHAFLPRISAPHFGFRFLFRSVEASMSCWVGRCHLAHRHFCGSHCQVRPARPACPSPSLPLVTS